MTTHTQGQWKVAGYKYNNPERIYDDVFYGDDKQNRICRVFMDDTPEQKANINLIAASPCMLAALSSALVYLCDENRGADDLLPVIEQLQAAIAKAKGEA